MAEEPSYTRLLLRSISLEQYAAKLDSEGFDTELCLQYLRPEDLKVYGVKPGHARAILGTAKERHKRSRQASGAEEQPAKRMRSADAATAALQRQLVRWEWR